LTTTSGLSRISEEIEVGNQDPKNGNRPDPRPTEAATGDAEMNDDMQIMRGSGNVFRDLGHPEADREQLRALLAAKIIGVLEDRRLTARAA
jgi:hypothetical protein